jgi:glycine betaine/choline ABC-type transport system substrate-binding protein
VGEWRLIGACSLGWKRVGAAILSTLALGCVVVGCGGASAKQPDEVTITVYSRGYPEDVLLREIYAQALEGAGFEVKRFNGSLRSISQALENGELSGYPDYLDTALTEVTPLKLAYAPGSPEVAYEEAKREFGKKGLVPFPPASVARKNAVGLLKRTAHERSLKTLSDLRGPAEEMSVKGPPYCHTRTDCVGGLERRYGIVFGGGFTQTKSIRSSGPLYKALKKGEVDAVMLSAIDGRLLGKDWLTLLEDDENRLPAANVFWMTSQDVVDEAGPDYEKAILAAQKGLTVEVMRKLNAKVELEEEPPAKVAAEYLKSIGLKG